MIGWRTRECVTIMVLICVTFVAMIGPAYAEWLDDKHQKLCSPHGGVHMILNAVPTTANMQACTDGCFRYMLICRKNVKFLQYSQYSPYAGNDDIFFAQGGIGTVVKLLMIFVLGGFATISVFGIKGREDPHRFIIQNAGVVAVSSIVVWLWGIRAVSAGTSLLDIIDFMLSGIVKYGVVPVFIAIRFPSFIRGWDYLFVRHPAASLVTAGGAADTDQLAATLVAGAADPGRAGTYHYEHQTEKAQSLAADLVREAARMEALAERKRRRAELLEAERLLEAIRLRSKGST